MKVYILEIINRDIWSIISSMKIRLSPDEGGKKQRPKEIGELEVNFEFDSNSGSKFN